MEGQYTFLVDGDPTTLPVTVATVEVSTAGNELQQYTCVAINTHEGVTGTAEGNIFLGGGEYTTLSYIQYIHTHHEILNYGAADGQYVVCDPEL